MCTANGCQRSVNSSVAVAVWATLRIAKRLQFFVHHIDRRYSISFVARCE
jgi:hypothetical protein